MLVIALYCTHPDVLRARIKGHYGAPRERPYIASKPKKFTVQYELEYGFILVLGAAL